MEKHLTLPEAMNKLPVALFPVLLAALTACSTPEPTPLPPAVSTPLVPAAYPELQTPAVPTPTIPKKAKPAVKKSAPAQPREECIQKTQTVISTETIVS